MYDYSQERPKLFTDAGQRLFLKLRDYAHRLLEEAGAVRMDRITRAGWGDGWFLLACVDRMVELGELRELTGPTVPAQARVFVKVGE